MRMKNLKINDPGQFECFDEQIGCNSSGNFPLTIIRMAWTAGVSFEDLADGFGQGNGTMGGDWSGIRDSSDEAIVRMLTRSFAAMRFTPVSVGVVMSEEDAVTRAIVEHRKVRA